MHSLCNIATVIPNNNLLGCVTILQLVGSKEVPLLTATALKVWDRGHNKYRDWSAADRPRCNLGILVIWLLHTLSSSLSYFKGKIVMDNLNLRFHNQFRP